MFVCDWLFGFSSSFHLLNPYSLLTKNLIAFHIIANYIYDLDFNTFLFSSNMLQYGIWRIRL